MVDSSSVPSRPRVSPIVQKLPRSGIRRFFDLIASLDGVISLGVGEPDFVTPKPLREAGIESIRAGRTKYTSNYGLLELRELLAEHLARLYGVRYDPHRELLITTGVSEGLDLACRAVLVPGDEVLCHDPYYVAYKPTAVLTGATFVAVPTYRHEDFRLRVEALEAAITPQSKVLILGYPCNPTGAVMSRAELEAIAEVVLAHDLLVISDEIYDRLVYGVEHVCFASLPGMRERTILLGGFSKSYAMTGWRVGWAAAPPDLLEAMMTIHQYGMMSAPTQGQWVAVEALRSGEPYVQEMVAEYDRRRRLMVRGLREIGLDTFEPKGAFYIFPDISITGLSDEEFAERLLLEEKVAVVPGSVFGEQGRGHVRICYAARQEDLEESLERMARFIARCVDRRSSGHE